MLLPLNGELHRPLFEQRLPAAPANAPPQSQARTAQGSAKVSRRKIRPSDGPRMLDAVCAKKASRIRIGELIDGVIRRRRNHRPVAVILCMRSSPPG